MIQANFRRDLFPKDMRPLLRSQFFPLNKLPDLPETYLLIAFESGVPLPLMEKNPSVATRLLLQSIKKASRFLKKSSGLKQTKCLEALASSVGFSSWYSLNKYLLSIQQPADNLPKAWLERLKSAFPLMAHISPDLGPRPLVIKKMESLADTLSHETGIDRQVILDGVFAKICHSTDWGKVKNNSPLKRNYPAYAFVNEGDITAHLEANHESQSLFVTLDGFGFWDPEANENEFLVQYIAELVHFKPDFLPGWQWLAEFFLDKDPSNSLHYASNGVWNAEFAIPCDYSGKLALHYDGNRVYLRLLVAKLRALAALCAKNTSLKDKAKSLGEKILSMTESDYFNVSEILKQVSDS